MKPSMMDTERSAAKLRRYLKLARQPELQLICGLRFFTSLDPNAVPGVESYIREFVPLLAEAVRKSNPREFLPEDRESLAAFHILLKGQRDGVVAPADLAVFKQLYESISAGSDDESATKSPTKHETRLTCLFVEHYPELDLPPRGRMLYLTVTATKISAKADADDIVVRNPVAEPDDRFLAQARDSVRAARVWLVERHGLSERKRYRFDFAVDTTGARFTGDSLGVAFAVGALAALSKIEVFRERLGVSPAAAFSGALSSAGKLTTIDAEALRLKIYRAFHSGLKYLVIPREHLTTAWTYVRELETQSPARKLELLGADTLAAVATDPRLLPVERFSPPAYIARKVWHTRRSVWVEVPALMVLLAILFFLVAPARWMPWFDDNPAHAKVNTETNTLEVFNLAGDCLWTKEFPCKLGGCPIPPICDLTSDGKNEVLFMLSTTEEYERRGRFFCYGHDGTLLFERNCAILGEYPPDTVGVLYDTGIFNIAWIGGEPLIITAVTQQLPARSHIRIWDGRGDSLGWYINAGHGGFHAAIDLDADGREELLFLVINNFYECTALLVLQADSSYGVSPPYEHPTRDLSNVKRGNQLAYMLFPVSDLGKTVSHAEYNYPSVLGIRRQADGLIEVNICESDDDPAIILVYSLDLNLRVVKVSRNDFFNKLRRQLVDDGKLRPIEVWDAYDDHLRDAVTYWIDSGWVTEGQLRAGENCE